MSVHMCDACEEHVCSECGDGISPCSGCDALFCSACMKEHLLSSPDCRAADKAEGTADDGRDDT